ncbi:response regulator [Fictibacillus enclensis]|uniref:response regulator transcription factor n=1 Tax=Fictibacillus enclensis TaxID=1017270 RepID=UPI0025A1E093|nr:response regulator [Fictibacillus enclensis]MDM5200850.1 response regulator [Fictibacillus enclensis]
MTLRVLIVDDEPIIVQGLKETVPWDQINAEVVGEAYDGEEAIEILQETEVDVILSDVKMPVMDGLKLREWVYKNAPGIETVMVSGYEEFEYAQRALRLGVKDYLLKPVDIEELMVLVQKISNERRHDLEKECRQHLQRLLTDTVLDHEMDGEDRRVTCLEGKHLLLLGSEMQQYHEKTENLNSEQEQELKQRWKAALENELNSQDMISASFFSDQNRLITLCLAENDDKEKEHFLQVQKGLEKKAGFSCFLCMTAVEVSQDLKSGYQELLHGLDGYPFQPEPVYWSSEVGDSSCSFSCEEEVRHVFQLEEADDTAEAAEKLFLKFSDCQYTAGAICMAISSVEHSLLEGYPKAVRFEFLMGVNPTVYNSYDQLKNLFLKDLSSYFSFQQRAAHEGSRWLIKKAVSYIQKHYAEDLKAGEVAGIIHVSPNHFSQLIKQETGKHFNDFLHEVRLEQAKKLLKETSCRVFEIAERVGYREYKYFVHIFKKSTTLTPTQYRNLVHAHGGHERNPYEERERM